MKQNNLIILFAFMLSVVTGCESSSPEITEEEAESIVIERHSEEVKIVSVNHRSGKYIVEWEIDADCEFGTYYIDDQSGRVLKGEETNC